MKSSPNITALAKELDVNGRLLYKWRDQLEPLEDGEQRLSNTPEAELRKELAQSKRLLADKTLEADFFRGALQKVEARRQRSGNTGETASTPKSGS